MAYHLPPVQLASPQALSGILSIGLPQVDALTLASRIADALHAAHERGHVLGNLRLIGILVADDHTVTFREPTGIDQVAHARIASYLSPEQLRGRAIDRRADIWAFGCVLFEMLSGTPAFSGDTEDAARAAVLERHPDWSRLPATVPARIVHLLQHCLHKDPKDRLHDIADARIEIDATRRLDTAFIERASQSRLGARLGWIVAAGLLITNAWLAWSWLRAAPSTAAGSSEIRSVRALIPVSPGTTLVIGRGSSLAISPDGRQLVYVAESQGRTQLYRRLLDRSDAVPIDGSAGAADPFFSPDGRWIGFLAGENLMKIPADGGAAVTLADAPTQRGIAWGEDDTIYVTPRDNTGVWRVPASGGTLEQVTTLADGEVSHRWPQVLPGGSALIYTIWDGAWDPARVAIQPLAGGRPDPGRPRSILFTGGGSARYVPGPAASQGSIVYASDTDLMSVPFDLSRLAVTGKPTPIADRPVTNFSGGAQLAVSRNGVVAYISSSGEADQRELAWVTRDGTVTPAVKLRGIGRWFDLSPDGRRVVRYKGDGAAGAVWVDDLAGGASTLVTPNGAGSAGPTERLNAVWSGDGRHIAYAAGTPLNVFAMAADGQGTAQQLTTSVHTQWPSSWSRDGRLLAYVENHPQSGADIWLVALDGLKPGAARPFLSTPFNESAPMISPDGRWLAYQSNESGRYEVYVQPFPDGGRRIQVSADNGVYPRWSARGDELFFRSLATRAGMSAAAFDGRGHFTVRQIFELARFESILDVSPDAQRFLMMPAVTHEAAPSQINIVTNWMGGRER